MEYRVPEDSKRSPTRGRRFRREAEALGRPGVEHVAEPDAFTRYSPNGTQLRAGVRPLLKVTNERFLEHMTERQRRRRKVRTARSWGRMLTMLEKTGMSLEEFVETLTPEELVRGKLRDKNGKFTGAPPSWVPAEFHRACIKELMRRGKEMWQVNYLDAITAMTEIATGKVKGATAGDRLRAAQFVVERLEGKTPEIVLVGTDEPWQVVIDDIVAQVPDEMVQAAKNARAQGVGLPVLEGEIVSEEPSPPRPVRSQRRRAR